MVINYNKENGIYIIYNVYYIVHNMSYIKNEKQNHWCLGKEDLTNRLIQISKKERYMNPSIL